MDDESASGSYRFRDLRRSVIAAGYRGGPDDVDLVDSCLDHEDPGIRSVSISAADRLGRLTPARLATALGDPEVSVRRRAVELAAHHAAADLTPLLHDPDASVVEVACWAAGEHEQVRDAVIERLIALSTHAEDPLVRESATAALGAIGDRRGLRAILTACGDKPAVRRRAVLALAAFMGRNGDDGDQRAVAAAIEAALADRDWQVRQAAEDLQRAARAGERFDPEDRGR